MMVSHLSKRHSLSSGDLESSVSVITVLTIILIVSKKFITDENDYLCLVFNFVETMMSLYQIV